ncbi:TPA: hypothetical protein IAD52_01320 [Candidatus Spyradomonas excrementavium]|nr:hypothetical protein [Candidatus Spyradomonas excrementavium]
MVSPIGSNINAIQMFTAANAFKSTMSNPITQSREPVTSDGIELNDDGLLRGQDLAEIKKYAKMIDENISDDDIKYGLSYGRSVIAEYLA